jgi:hypothetical protein
VTPTQARDAINGVVRDMWNRLYLPESNLVWNDVPGQKPTGELPWGRVTIKHNLGYRGSLANHNGNVLHRNEGTVIIQIFSPMAGGDVEGYYVAQFLQHAYKKNHDGVWFRNSRINEVGPDGAFEQINVNIDFEYDDNGIALEVDLLFLDSFGPDWEVQLDTIDNIINVLLPSYLQVL